MPVLPEAPRLIAWTGRYGAVREALSRTRRAADLKQEFEEVRPGVREDSQ